MRIIIALILAAVAAFYMPANAQESGQMGLNGSTSVINAVVQEPIRSYRAFGKKLNRGALCNLQTRDKVQILGKDETGITVRRVRRLSRVSLTINLKFWQYVPKSLSRSEICPRDAVVKIPLHYEDPLVKSWEAHKANEELRGGKKE